MFRMEIKTGGAAFCNLFTGEEDRASEGQEIARILRKVANEIEHGEVIRGPVFDMNGNKVGSYSR